MTDDVFSRFSERAALLEKGNSPRIAAKLTNIGCSTIYNWKREDQELAAKWDDAIETGIDAVETALVKRALKSCYTNAHVTTNRRTSLSV